MIKLRLSRVGQKNHILYRIVAAEEYKKSKGKHLEIIGFYDPKKKVFKLDKEKYQKWISNGARASESLKKLVKN